MKKRALIFSAIFAWIAVASAPADAIVFAGYNVENYIAAGEKGAKTEKEKSALLHILKNINADILGVCEMGAGEQFDDFKKRLAEAGLGYKDFEFVEAADPARHLALASRLPIVERHSISKAAYQLDGREQQVKRGFLDVTVQIAPDFRLRLVGCHLKSKLAVPEGEALMRRNEAHLLRAHIDEILKSAPDTKLVVYGDFNDTKNEPTFHEITGVRGAPDHLYDLWLKDDRGERWTHYWKWADLYSRIDFIFVNRALQPLVDQEKSRIYRGADWNDASDHCPVIATIRTKK